jgi:hypothetical protein
MRDKHERYKHFIPNLDLSIERNTANVPNDGRFHIVKVGTVVQSFRSRKLAEEKFRQLLAESGFKPELPPHSDKINPLDESTERYFMAKNIFWAEGPISRKKGGRGGRGGV